MDDSLNGKALSSYHVNIKWFICYKHLTFDVIVGFVSAVELKMNFDRFEGVPWNGEKISFDYLKIDAQFEEIKV